MQELLPTFREPLTIISIVGKQGSGKSTIAKEIAKYHGLLHIEVSDVVRSLSGSIPREDLYMTSDRTRHDKNWLAKGILDKIQNRLVVFRPIVISGVREQIVHNLIKEAGHKLVIIALEANAEVRYERLKELGKCSDLDSFIEQETNQESIGISDVIELADEFFATHAKTMVTVFSSVNEYLEGRGIVGIRA